MNTKLLAVAGVVALGLVGVASAFVVGIGPVPGDTSGDDIDSSPRATSTPTPTHDGTTEPAQTATTSTEPFAFSIDRIEECGRTCRDVTSTLTNQQETTSDDVTVYTRIYVGKDTDGDVAWQGTETVGSLAAGESHTVTRRVELSYSDAIAVEQNDGWVTVQTTVQTGDRIVMYTDQRQVG
jgi:hypothetical protein